MSSDKKRNIFGAIVITMLLALIVTGAFLKNGSKTINIGYADFLEHVRNGNVLDVVLTNDPQFKFRLKGDDTTYLTDNPRNPQLKEELLLQNIPVGEGSVVTVDSIAQSAVSVLFFAGAVFFVYKMSGRQNPKSVMAFDTGDVRVANRQHFSFDDIAGNEEAKESVQDVVDFIRTPEKYAAYGARMPRGVIFYGPPGTGKTLIAKAVAGEAGVPFFAVSGSDFVQMFVGVGAGRIRELFKKAKEAKQAVIFVDEIDALGKKRGMSGSGGNDERDQTLNALLTEMSGFSSGEGIVVIAATNRLDTLDEALLRPGRFDRQVEIGLPDLNARRHILAHHAHNKPISEEVDVDKLARQTVYFSGAMLENLLNEAAICAAKRGLSQIDSDDIDKAYYTVVAGSEKKDRSGIKENERRVTAYHEAGHAVMAKMLSPENTVAKITVIPSTKGAGGFCINVPPEKMYFTKKELESQMMVSLAGRAAEELAFGADNVSTGAANDIEKATAIVKDYVTRYGMSDKYGLLNAALFKQAVGVMEECGVVLDKLYAEAVRILKMNWKVTEGIVRELLAKETLHEEELDRLMESGGDL